MPTTWNLNAILKNNKGNHVTAGKVLGTLRSGVSIDWSPSNIELHVGRLSGPRKDRCSFTLHVREARSLGYSLLLAAAELEVALERQKDLRQGKREAPK